MLTRLRAAPGETSGRQSPLGWYVVRVNNRRTNPDGDPEADVQTILVATETLANELKAGRSRAKISRRLLVRTPDSNAQRRRPGIHRSGTLPRQAAGAVRASTGNGLLSRLPQTRIFRDHLIETANQRIPTGRYRGRSESLHHLRTDKASSNYVAALSDV
jgi:hypothetical protein